MPTVVSCQTSTQPCCPRNKTNHRRSKSASRIKNGYLYSHTHLEKLTSAIQIPSLSNPEPHEITAPTPFSRLSLFKHNCTNTYTAANLAPQVVYSQNTARGFWRILLVVWSVVRVLRLSPLSPHKDTSARGPVAQRIRHLTTNQGIPGSNPGRVVTKALPGATAYVITPATTSFAAG